MKIEQALDKLIQALDAGQSDALHIGVNLRARVPSGRGTPKFCCVPKDFAGQIHSICVG